MIAHVMLYAFPTSAVEGPLSCGAVGMSHCGGGAVTVTVADAVAPPADTGSAALMVALPMPTPITLKVAVLDAAGMTTDGCTLAMSVLDELSVTVVSLATLLLVCTVNIVESFMETVPAE